MATLNEWTLPLNQTSPYPFYLQYLTPPVKERLFYTKYIIDIIGELDLKRAATREWAIPRGLWQPTYPGQYGANPDGITLDAGGMIWSALQDAHRLLRLDPRSGSLIAYGATHGNPSSRNYNNYPIPYPTKVTFDKNDNAWYIGDGVVGWVPQGPLIGKLNADRKSADYWVLPQMGLITPSDLWVLPGAEQVWFTLYNTSYLKTAPFLGCLYPLQSKVTYWYNSYPSVIWGIGTRGIVGDSPTDLQRIWFTFNDSTANSGTYRLDVGTGSFFLFKSSSDLHRIALDFKGHPWISDWNGKISVLKSPSQGVKMEFPSKTVELAPKNMQVKAVELTVEPESGTATRTTQNVAPVQNNEYVDFLTFPVSPNGIAVSDYPARVTVYFSQGSGIIIGQLLP